MCSICGCNRAWHGKGFRPSISILPPFPSCPCPSCPCTWPSRTSSRGSRRHRRTPSWSSWRPPGRRRGCGGGGTAQSGGGRRWRGGLRRRPRRQQWADRWWVCTAFSGGVPIHVCLPTATPVNGLQGEWANPPANVNVSLITESEMSVHAHTSPSPLAAGRATSHASLGR